MVRPRGTFRLRGLFVLPALLATVLGISCGDGRRPVFPVQGQVLFEGKPTPGALVIFHPVNDPDPSAPKPLARVGADGRFAPTTYGGGDGAPAGEYVVTVVWVNEVDNQTVPKEELREPQNLIPDRYSRPETSGLRVAIKKERNELPPFRLSRK